MGGDLQRSASGALFQSERLLVKDSRIPWARLGARGSSRGRRLLGERLGWGAAREAAGREVRLWDHRGLLGERLC